MNKYPWVLSPEIVTELRVLFYSPDFPRNPTLEELLEVILDEAIERGQSVEDLADIITRTQSAMQQAHVLPKIQKILSRTMDEHLEVRSQGHEMALFSPRHDKRHANTPAQIVKTTDQSPSRGRDTRDTKSRLRPSGDSREIPPSRAL